MVENPIEGIGKGLACVESFGFGFEEINLASACLADLIILTDGIECEFLDSFEHAAKAALAQVEFEGFKNVKIGGGDFLLHPQGFEQRQAP